MRRNVVMMMLGEKLKGRNCGAVICGAGREIEGRGEKSRHCEEVQQCMAATGRNCGCCGGKNGGKM